MPSDLPPERSQSLPGRILAQLFAPEKARTRAVDIPKIPGALKWYQVSAYVTGIMLLLLVAEMIVKYGFHYSLYAFGNHGALALVWWDPTGTLPTATGMDVSTAILIVHGWLYVVYLFCDFRLWSFMRWSGPRFLLIAAGGVVPFMSFIVEGIITKQVKAFLATHQAQARSTVEASH
ncbi:DUF3817 domain-containing protein [Leifsonia sp. Root112D2]|uniref:DUF3817 domain-containing protein n=1 Tax=Leifsonia sp. Root112D2 TaxID=1736426 RepID=UPI0009EC90C9|nr:DUF3817 domain-containing protein [Leifsonia sp. Root112D2]